MWAEGKDSRLLGPCPGQNVASRFWYRVNNAPLAGKQQMKQKAVQDPFQYARQEAEKAESRCLIGPEKECGPKIIKAHWLQQTKLKLIAKDGKVLVMTPDLRKPVRAKLAMPRTWRQYFEIRSISNRLMTGRMACAYHDNQTFSEIENRRLDPSNLHHCLLLAYRAVLFQLHEKRVAAKTFETLAPSHRLFAVQYRLLREAVSEVSRAKAHLDKLVFAGRAPNGAPEMEHVHVSIESGPSVAASAVIMRDGPRIAFTPRELEAVIEAGVPRSPYPVPIIITVYPEPKKHIAIVSFLKGTESLARIVVPAIDEPRRGHAAALLSKTLLEESENIIVSPTAWQSFGRAKRRRIFQQFDGTVPRPVPVAAPRGTVMSESLATTVAHSHEPAFIDEGDPEELNLFT